jgi:hypothetical protein
MKLLSTLTTVAAMMATAITAAPVENNRSEALVVARSPEGGCAHCYVPLHGVCVRAINCSCEFLFIPT